MNNHDLEVWKRELKKLAKEKGGRFTPEDIVKRAESKASPLHTFFEWDDAVAGHLWRIEQAKRYIRIQYEEKENEPPRRVYIATERPDTGSRYGNREAELARVEMRREMIKRSCYDLKRWLTQYSDIEELGEIVPQVEGILAMYAEEI